MTVRLQSSRLSTGVDNFLAIIQPINRAVIPFLKGCPHCCRMDVHKTATFFQKSEKLYVNQRSYGEIWVFQGPFLPKEVWITMWISWITPLKWQKNRSFDVDNPFFPLWTTFSKVNIKQTATVTNYEIRFIL